METILVTGGAGYIGSHTCKLLAESGYEPVTYDNLSTGHEIFVKWGPLVVGDLHDTARLAKTIALRRPVGVIHFAASAYVGESVADPFKYYWNNVGGTLSLLEAMRLGGTRNIVFSSTCATYGVPQTRLIDEEVRQNPINPYGQSKLMIEQILRDLSARDELRFIALRYFNAAGADEDGELGEWHEPETHLIPLAIQSATGGARLKVFGTDFDTSDGTAVRDYVHVEDLARGHLSAIEHLVSGGTSDAINLGTGCGSSVREVIGFLERLGVPVDCVNSGRRDGDPAYLVADNRKAGRVLNWAPAYGIAETLATAVNWHRRHGK
jgi:UDP-glucose-4-epimerase GalE